MRRELSVCHLFSNVSNVVSLLHNGSAPPPSLARRMRLGVVLVCKAAGASISLAAAVGDGNPRREMNGRFGDEGERSPFGVVAIQKRTVSTVTDAHAFRRPFGACVSDTLDAALVLSAPCTHVAYRT